MKTALRNTAMLSAFLVLSAGGTLAADYPQIVSCSISDDQLGSFCARDALPTLPIAVYISPNFTTVQQNAVFRAMREWNTFGLKSFGKNIFDWQQGSPLPSYALAANPSQYFEQSSQISRLAIVPAVLEGSILGLTSSSGTTLDWVRSSVVLTQHLIQLGTLSAGVNRADDEVLASVALHELGHVMGLDHTCTNKRGHSDFASCWNLPSPAEDQPSPYFLAVMYPEVMRNTDSAPDGSVLSEGWNTKEQLTMNDLQRSYCSFRPEGRPVHEIGH